LARVAPIVTAVAALACAGGRSGSDRGGLPGASQEKAPPPEDEVAAPVALDAGIADPEDAGEQDDPEQRNAFDEAMLAITGQQQASKRAEPPLGLRFGVVERGPGKRWLLALLNEGKAAVRVIADQRLLWFEVEVPGKRAKKTTWHRSPRGARARARRGSGRFVRSSALLLRRQRTDPVGSRRGDQTVLRLAAQETAG
jgi:hypothetical protein